MGFRITSGKGFHVSFDNGWIVSAQFGPGDYCDNRYKNMTDEQAGRVGCKDACVALFRPDGKLFDFRSSGRYDGTALEAVYMKAELFARLLHEASMLGFKGPSAPLARLINGG